METCMKNYVIFIIVIFIAISSYGQSKNSYIIKYQINKPYCIFNFMETLRTNGYYGPTLFKFYQNSKFNEDETLKGLLDEYKKLKIHYSYEYSNYPKFRFLAKDKSTSGLLYSLSAKTNTIEEFKQITVGILPFDQHQKLFKIYEAVEPIYDELVWDQYYDVAQQRVKALEEYSQKINLNEKLAPVVKFFNNSWPGDVPVIVSFSIVPGNIIKQVPPPQGNVIFCGLLTETEDLSFYIGLIPHEFAHRAFAEQSLDYHQKIDQWLNNSKSPNRSMVNFMYNEVLGGAVGHKVKEDILGAHEFTYGQSFIKSFDEAIYPLVVSYLDAGKSIDSTFVEKSLDIYNETFPTAHREYEFLLQTYFLLMDTKDYSIPQIIMKNITQPMMYEVEAPILDEGKINNLINYDFAKLIIILKEHEKKFQFLQNKIPGLEKYSNVNTGSDFVLSFLGADGKAYIIINLQSMEKLEETLQLIKEQKMIDPDNPLLKIG